MWEELNSLDQFDELLENSRVKPALIFKHKPTSPESVSVKKKLEKEWDIPSDIVALYLVEDPKNREIIREIMEVSGVENEFPQVLLFADGVTMYDESHEMINVKKIQIALKIINRTFKWMESRA